MKDELARAIRRMAERETFARAAAIETACERALIKGCGVRVNETEGWARPDPAVPYGRMLVEGVSEPGVWTSSGDDAP